MAKSSRSSKTAKKSAVRNSRTTVSGPAQPDNSGAGDIVAKKASATQDVASAFPFNPNKAAEYDPDAAVAPPEGASVKPEDPIVGASTVSEINGSEKLGSGGPNIGHNPTVGPLDRVRVDSTDRVLTTNQGVSIADNQNSLKAGLRGPTLLEDFILREKITHFDHERIPERIVHARGSAAHGFFECTKAIPEFTRASLFSEVGKQTPVFVRFSTVLGERGSTDTARDVRGFAVKFYTDEGSIRTRRVAILVADGCDGDALVALADRLTSEGAVPRFVSTTLGSVQPVSGDAVEVDVSLEAAPSVLYDAVVLPDGAEAVKALRADGRTLEFIKDQYRHCKPILAVGAGDELLKACGIDTMLPDGQPDPGVLTTSDASTAGDGFIAAIAKHRHFARETDPPRV
jgi:putative intracellular protease/amidase